MQHRTRTPSYHEEGAAALLESHQQDDSVNRRGRELAVQLRNNENDQSISPCKLFKPHFPQNPIFSSKLNAGRKKKLSSDTFGHQHTKSWGRCTSDYLRKAPSKTDGILFSGKASHVLKMVSHACKACIHYKGLVVAIKISCSTCPGDSMLLGFTEACFRLGPQGTKRRGGGVSCTNMKWLQRATFCSIGKHL